ncbi:MAG: bifunctional [glutamate--ammonia ligase]-adenylyl-L-tyrosine phosphorylase/[glutamate--ammonia-ligase] adenylyltransferase [Wenzhouxiangellaceae bacterium]|nr:bifunctional [glutamate--ammonia ligase]-adenylyl-L-tyrosine phosphorylase/[glutamate--ammonia-ligase] adenylyltransferase [Wenzhouxiangellaceae bacterium]MBS3822735.1 bifunctional [glutamate--ammonia ligase]-adenylyl-L-tyrosine phosphorylase/[glutamate--ammonia-ligase] adenylyltransferase [Wenzhouxiangellaceae bacterium]
MSDAAANRLAPADFVAASGYAREVLRRWRLEPDWLVDEAEADDPELPVASRLRRYRQLEALRIQWQEIQGLHDVEETGRRLSGLACECLERALGQAEAAVAERHGRLETPEGGAARLAVLALGKLGGNELNFNSDLDLVFCHAASGQSDGRRSLEPRDYFSRVVRELSGLMEEVTSNGRVWVVDTRLRPFGQAGAVVWSVDAMEQYFVNEGRAWERYAWLKARPVAGDLALGSDLLARIRPFVFRRYLDYGLFDNLRSLHAEIETRSHRDELQDDIKRGPGGIRELEFLVQSLQLLRGGREPALRTPGFLAALRAARDARLLEEVQFEPLNESYRFLRALENRLQLVTGRQTHELPADTEQREALALLMGLSDWNRLASRISKVRERVRELFRKRFGAPEQRAEPVRSLWPPTPDLRDSLAGAGFEDPAAAASALEQLHQRLGRRPLSAEGRRRLDRLMPELLEEVLQHDPPDTGLGDLLALVETIARRSAYLALLHERPQTLARCVRVFRGSARVAAWITASPQLLDDLLAPDKSPELPRLPSVQPEDVENSLNALARFRQAGFVRTALGQLDETLGRPEARRRLTRLAEAVLACMAELFLPENEPPAIIGYGNLGASELHYTSDLDLVFLHRHGEPPVRAVQRLINAMQLPMPGGKLYEIDTRLRPNGNAGMLVSTLQSFADYQDRHAWTWEHQALIRARCVFGSDAFRERFEEIRAEVLVRPRDPDEVRRALADMRKRQLAQRAERAEKRLLGDIQFIAELGVLLNAAQAPALVEARATIEQLTLLGEHGWLKPQSVRQLIDVFNEAALLRDRLFLERECRDALPETSRRMVAEAWRALFEDG